MIALLVIPSLMVASDLALASHLGVLSLKFLSVLNLLQLLLLLHRLEWRWLALIVHEVGLAELHCFCFLTGNHLVS